ncbi:MAG: protein phosphatase 2C domain-containing protein [Chlorogloeopsis fritschii C42_A2020_084]|uniref:protein phosphatase 2C domain-containing protein n=1 Tax=Chlorogloeopsis fritschii TaxID=1124 RepID=UPI0019E2517C|nr:protein phosphatase 2C domain-containing protein [Chlorogloeopsis fritschii]MBF2006404.1 protein phosphatase 2C domain-containing protein [Chlorogloeopsis fritschii C42_A2020_084]
MISTEQLIYCPNPTCANPINPVGNSLCGSCQTPLIKRYLWAVGEFPTKISPGEMVAERYEVIAPQIWLDTQPGKLPEIPEEISDEVIPYLRLYPQRLHLPQIYGCVRSLAKDGADILLLENAPVDEVGNLYPAIASSWQQATAIRQVYWLWQILQLWTPLSELGVAASLLKPDNLRVQGWCVRLLQLQQSKTTKKPSLQDLAECWQPWVNVAKTQVAAALEKIVRHMSNPDADLVAISTQLNTLLLASAAQLPLTPKMAGATDIGSQELTQNEDSCFPTANDSIEDPLLLQAAIICDGIGGHEGGEVASLLAMQSLKLQIRALLKDIAEQTEIVPPDVVQKQLEASLRVVNNVICNCNNEQKRGGTQRMATTVVMAVQVPQNIRTTSGSQSENSHELYLTSIGDSRAYWITCNYCQQLTVDDDVVAREVSNARSFYHKALQRPDASALTQALGTKDGEFLCPWIQRLIIEEDGILLLCSDGFSDNNLVEQSWREYALPALTGEFSLEDALYSWVKLASEKNAHDNISLVLIHYRVSPDYPVLVTSRRSQIEIVEEKEVEIVTETQLEVAQEPELAQSSQLLLDLDISEPATATATQIPTKSQPRQHKPKFMLIGLLIVLLGGTTVAFYAWSQFHAQSFQQLCRQLPQITRQFCMPQK